MFLTMLDRAPPETQDSDRFDSLSILFHWANLALLVAAFATIWAHEQASDSETAALWLELHRSIGVTIWLLTLARLLWKAGYAQAPEPPATMPKSLRRIAQTHHGVLYALLILQPLTGFLQSLLRGKSFPLFGGDFPAILLRDKRLSHLLLDIHEMGATTLLAMVGLHAVAALFHGLVLRDGVLGGMLPFRFLRRNRPDRDRHCERSEAI